jgi:cobalt-zinc-cadmium resistance protein CzcA
MQYQVLLDPDRLYGYHLTVPQVIQALTVNNANTGGGFYSQGGQFYYVRGIGLVRNQEEIGNIIVGSNKGVPIRVRDIGEVTIGNAPRLGQFGFQDKQKNNDDAVEGVILMRRGEQAQNVLQGVQKKTEELNRSVLPKDVKIRPFYDRSDLVRLTTDTVEANLLRGMILVFIVLVFFLVSWRAALIVTATIPLSLLFAFIFLHARLGGVQHHEYQVGIGGSLVGLLDTNGFSLVVRSADARGVDQVHGNPAQRDSLGDQVAGGAGRGSDDGSLALNQPIKEG